MNNKGFTLIELIMTIMIISVLAVLTTPNIIKYIDKNKVDNYKETIDSIKKAAELYVTDNKYELVLYKDLENRIIDNCKPGDTKSIKTTIEVNDLVHDKYLNSKIKDFCTNKLYENDKLSVVATLNCKTKKFTYTVYNDNVELSKDDACKN